MAARTHTVPYKITHIPIPPVGKATIRVFTSLKMSGEKRMGEEGEQTW